MSSKIITYDLCSPGRDYEDLYKAIKSYGVWAHITESTWFVNSTETCVEVRNKLLNCVDSNDRLFVGELTGVAAWRNVICDNDYLKKYL